MHFIFSIEGNIGSGKSTLVKLLKNYNPKIDLHDFKIIYLPEPVDEWHKFKNKDGTDIIEEFYNDPKKWAFSFQMLAYISRLHILKETIRKNPHSIIISERSVYTDKNVFAEMLYTEGSISEIDYQIYNKWFEEFVKDLQVSGLIYVKTSSDKCLNRINKWNRKGETIDINYLTKCCQFHDNWINTHPNVLTLDGDIDFGENHNKLLLEQWIVNITDFIKNTECIKKQSNMFELSNVELINILR